MLAYRLLPPDKIVNLMISGSGVQYSAYLANLACASQGIFKLDFFGLRWYGYIQQSISIVF